MENIGNGGTQERFESDERVIKNTILLTRENLMKYDGLCYCDLDRTSDYLEIGRFEVTDDGITDYCAWVSAQGGDEVNFTDKFIGKEQLIDDTYNGINISYFEDKECQWIVEISREEYDSILKVIQKYIKKADDLREEFLKEQRPIIKRMVALREKKLNKKTYK